MSRGGQLMNKISRYFLASLFCGIFVVGCSTQRPPPDTEKVADLEQLTQQELQPKGPVVAKIREQALKETALSIGAQGGLSMRSRQINELLTQNQKELDRIFNFSGLMLPDNVLPPVLEESHQSLSLVGPNIITLSDHTYHILKQARFVTAPPTWRDYLWMDYQKPTLPDTSLLPQNKQERKLWKTYIDTGFHQGIDQANNIYQSNVASLRRDYAGMMLYRDLFAKNMVTRPYVVSSRLGVTSNSDHTEMRINDQVLEIAAVPQLNANSNRWKPIMVEPQDGQS
ncbi:MAG: hypothetical protein A2X77_01735 [Gammaproteobacteria bacterium GWE2_42_36]|nr:MAG: hypothetical protein A2X77_01735 [Gammaproteobacteria bacterium GWE2_42_36]